MTVKVAHINGLMIASLTVLVLSYQACSDPNAGFKSTHAAGGTVYASGGTTTDNPKPTLTVGIDPFPTTTEGPQILICVTEIRIGKDGSQITVDSAPKWIELNPKGTLVNPDVRIPPGTYSQMQLRLDDKCNGASIDVINSHGHFEMSKRADLKFSGSVVVDAKANHIDLDMSNIVTALNQVKESEDLEKALEGSSGGCSGN